MMDCPALLQAARILSNVCTDTGTLIEARSLRQHTALQTLHGIKTAFIKVTEKVVLGSYTAGNACQQELLLSLKEQVLNTYLSEIANPLNW